MVLEIIPTGNEEEETSIKLNEDELCELLKVNSKKCIEHMSIFKTHHDLTFPCAEWFICPLFDLFVLLTLKRLEAKFPHDYYAVASVFYVSICNEQGEERLVLVENMDG
jgi:hypothetical protein